MITKKIAQELARNFISDLKQLGHSPNEAYLMDGYSEEPNSSLQNINLVLWGEHLNSGENEMNEFKYLIMDNTWLVIHTFNSKAMNNDPLAGMVRQNGLKLL